MNQKRAQNQSFRYTKMYHVSVTHQFSKSAKEATGMDALGSFINSIPLSRNYLEIWKDDAFSN